MSHLSPSTIRTDIGSLSFFHDARSAKLRDIEAFLSSETIAKLQQAISKQTYIVLGGDGLFVAIAKEAHVDEVQILGINFGSKGFLLHDQPIFDQQSLQFEVQEYPILHADITI